MDYDMTIHHNPDAQAWAKFFIETTKDMDREVFIDEGYMIVWFANAMMAMYDSMNPQKTANEIVRLRGVLLTVLEACEDVNSPDRKVREEITRTVRKALKEKE